MPVKPTSFMSMVGSGDLSSTCVYLHGTRNEVGVRVTGSTQTGVLSGEDEKLCGLSDGTEAGVSHQGS